MAEDANELAELRSQIQQAAADAAVAMSEISNLKSELMTLRALADKTSQDLAGFTITDDAGVFSGQGPTSIMANFSNLPDWTATATFDCDADPPTATFTFTQ